jgi:hypothetical protein
VAEPELSVDARPALSMGATAKFEELQTTSRRGWVELSLKFPVAVNGCVFPNVTLGLAGRTAIDCRVARVTVTAAVLVTEPSVAVMVDCPADKPVTTPF